MCCVRFCITTGSPRWLPRQRDAAPFHGDARKLAHCNCKTYTYSHTAEFMRIINSELYKLRRTRIIRVRLLRLYGKSRLQAVKYKQAHRQSDTLEYVLYTSTFKPYCRSERVYKRHRGGRSLRLLNTYRRQALLEQQEFPP